jgi:hypothetical protein
LPQDELEDALHHMCASGLVERVGRTSYAIAAEEAVEQPR